MTNTTTSETTNEVTNNETTANAPLTSWEMACSILVGVRQAIAKATSEHAAKTGLERSEEFLMLVSGIRRLCQT